MIVAHQREDAAEARRAREIDMAQYVAGAIDARPLAVPEAEDAVETPFAAHLRLLSAPDGGGGKIFVETRLKMDVARLKLLFGAGQIEIDAAERRAAVAGHEIQRF